MGVLRSQNFTRKVWVGNLQGGVTEDDLQRAFEKHGVVEEVILRDDYAFIIMQDEDSAAKAIQSLNDSLVPNTTVHSFCTLRFFLHLLNNELKSG